MSKRVFAIAAHPDDIEFMMSGTLFLLKDAGCEIHYLNVANGSCGTATMSEEEIAAVRKTESKNAAATLGAVHHESLVNDLEIFYNNNLISRLCSVIRDMQPDIVLTQYPVEYMEDHSNVCRVTVSAVFARSIKNFPSDPPRETTIQDVTIYHALPYGLTDTLRRPIEPDFYIDVSEKIENKAEMLAMHVSQKEWLDHSQGLDSFVKSMKAMTAKAGHASGQFTYAEGWTRHLHLGFCSEEANPLADILSNHISVIRP